MADVRRVGGGEGFGLYAASFEGQFAVLADCSTLNDFLEEGDADPLPVKVLLFESEAARASYLSTAGFFMFESARAGR